jgi:hypothetical protein
LKDIPYLDVPQGVVPASDASDVGI